MSTTTAAEPRITCRTCKAKIHSVQLHLNKKECTPGTPIDTVPAYQAAYPAAPLMSEMAERAIKDKAAGKAAVRAESPATPEAGPHYFHDVFGFGRVPAALSSKGNPVPVTVLNPIEEFVDMIPDLDSNYVFNVDILKSLLLGIEENIPVFLWGHSGTGKTTMYEQICARTRRPLLRVQHTANMEEEHVVGGWRLRDGHTHFELGPLPLAMKYGWTYLADEYDFARPEVSSVYQAVLEGKPLVIKEADAANRVIRPHQDFRIAATGNTNGQGDESQLYQGTLVQNAANFERFGIVEKMPYMDSNLEARLVAAQADIDLAFAKKLVDFATRIREEHDGARIGNPISPRSLIFAGRIGIARNDYRKGLEKAFINRLSSVDREAASQIAQRVFG